MSNQSTSERLSQMSRRGIAKVDEQARTTQSYRLLRRPKTLLEEVEMVAGAKHDYM